MQNFFTKILEDNLKAIIKPQYVDQIPKAIKVSVRNNYILNKKEKLRKLITKKKGKVEELLKARSEVDNLEHIMTEFELVGVRNRNVEDLSGGELQRFACAVTSVRQADIFMFDEPSSYLDVKQRLKAAHMIRELVKQNRYLIVVEHDLSVLDYLSDFVCCLYGSPGHYGVVTMPFSVREGINIFLDGFVPTENLRFRESVLTFKVSEKSEDDDIKRLYNYEYPDMTKNLGDFSLEVGGGSFTDSEIIVLLGENGTGKTTLIRMLAGNLEPDAGVSVPKLNISYKPQKISPKFEGTVKQLLMMRIRDAAIHPQFNTDVLKPLQIENLMDQEVKNLSGGELQRVAITLCLGKPADVYLIDEPSAYLDSEQRLHAAKVIKRYIRNCKKTAFIVEHDFIMATYLADRVIVFDGTPSFKTHASAPQSLLTGMNSFLKSLNITFRRDPENARPRINKLESVKDVEQKTSGNFFFLE